MIRENYHHNAVTLTKMETIEELYRHNASRGHDITEHLPYLAGIAMGKYVQELGFRTGRSTSAFLFGGAKNVIVCDPHPCADARGEFERLAPDRFRFENRVSLECSTPTVDILFIDSYHTGSLLRKELERFHPYAEEAIVMHDTETYGHVGEDGKEGLQQPIREFLAKHKEWGRMIHFPNNNGLTIIRKDPRLPFPDSTRLDE